jgi:endodeoxyribonuclease RusA
MPEMSSRPESKAVNLLDLTLERPAMYWWMEYIGEPIAKERVGWNKHRSYNPNEKDEEAIRLQIIATFPHFARVLPDESHLWGVRCIFYCSRIENVSTRDHYVGEAYRKAKRYRRKRKGNDTDNMLKLVKDAMNKFIWKDDSQVREDYVASLFSDRPRTCLLFYHLPPEFAVVES